MREETLRPWIANVKGTCVEIGTFKGDFAHYFLRETKETHLFCVDPYQKFDEGVYRDNINSHSQAQYDQLYEATKHRLEGVAPDRFDMIRAPSTEAAKRFPNNSVKFVYLDGNHDYKHVLEDLETWYPKMMPTGIMVGDDVNDTDESKRDANGDVKIEENGLFYGYYGVKKAVEDFCRDKGLKYMFLPDKQFILYISK